MKRMWLWVFIGLVVALGGWAAYSLISPATPSSSQTLEDYVKKMSRKTTTPNYIAFTGQAGALAGNMQRLQQQVRAGNWPEVDKALDTTLESYRRAWELAAQLEAESSLDALNKGFLAAADNALKAVAKEIDSKLVAEDKKLTLQQQALKQEKTRAEAEIALIRQQAAVSPQENKGGSEVYPGTVYFGQKAVPWLAIAFIAGFALLIPWYKKFADEAQYLSYSLSGSVPWTPTHILGVAAGVSIVLVVAYLLWRGYLAII